MLPTAVEDRVAALEMVLTLLIAELDEPTQMRLKALLLILRNGGHPLQAVPDLATRMDFATGYLELALDFD